MEIPLRIKGEIVSYALVSKEDYRHLSQFKWYKDKNYARGDINKKKWFLHRYIMIVILGNELTSKNHIDHINGNPLDNTRDNLRAVTFSENSRNRKKKDDTTSKYIGVSFNKPRLKWQASITINNNTHTRLNAWYSNELHAAHQYNLWVEEFELKTANKNEIDAPKDFVKYIGKEIKKGNNLPIGIRSISNDKFRVEIHIKKKRTNIGTYDNLEEAIIELEKAKIEKAKIEKEKLLSILILYNENGQCIFKIKETEVIIDEEMYYDIIKYKWCITEYGYIQGSKHGRLSRFVMNYSGDDFVDHINSNKLDNRRENLRIATAAQNAMNKSSAKDSSSKYTGVFFDKKMNKWVAQIQFKGKTKRIGQFTDEVAAAKDRDKATKEYFGEYGKLNFPEQKETIVVLEE